MNSKIRTYTELQGLFTFQDRFKYLSLQGRVGRDTFGFDRYLNQRFYRSREWQNIRHHVITRDLGCDLGVEGYDIYDKILIHHMNPVTKEDILDRNKDILDPEFLITTTHNTHNAIHYGDVSKLTPRFVERKPGDTKLW